MLVRVHYPITRIKSAVGHTANKSCIVYGGLKTLATDNSTTITSAHTALCDNWNFIGMMDTWCRQLGVCDMIDITGDSDTRGLEPIEQTWAFLHIATRWRIENGTSLLTIVDILQHVRLPRWSSSRETCKSAPTDLFARGQIDSCRKFNTAAMMMYGEYENDWRNKGGCFDMILDNFCRLRDTRIRSLNIAAMLPAQFEELRHRYRLFPLFVSQMIDECTRANLAAAPESLFNELAVIDWASKRYAITRDIFTPEKIFDGVYANMRPIYTHDRFLYLYGHNELLRAKYDGDALSGGTSWKIIARTLCGRTFDYRHRPRIYVTA